MVTLGGPWTRGGGNTRDPTSVHSSHLEGLRVPPLALSPNSPNLKVTLISSMDAAVGLRSAPSLRTSRICMLSHLCRIEFLIKLIYLIK